MANTNNVYADVKLDTTAQEKNFQTELNATKGMKLVDTKWGQVAVSAESPEEYERAVAKLKELEQTCRGPWEMRAAIMVWAAGLKEVKNVKEIILPNGITAILDVEKQCLYTKDGQVIEESPIKEVKLTMDQLEKVLVKQHNDKIAEPSMNRTQITVNCNKCSTNVPKYEASKGNPGVRHDLLKLACKMEGHLTAIRILISDELDACVECNWHRVQDLVEQAMEVNHDMEALNLTSDEMELINADEEETEKWFDELSF